MRQELQDVLFKRYPQFFRKPFQCSGKAYLSPFDEHGIECGDGWFDLIDRLGAACEAEIETQASEGVAQECWLRVAQIKDKMGGLRFYINGAASDELRALILQVEEEESRQTCEVCGGVSRLSNTRCPTVLCDSCWRKDV